jgi:hypothetical protein
MQAGLAEDNSAMLPSSAESTKAQCYANFIGVWQPGFQLQMERISWYFAEIQRRQNEFVRSTQEEIESSLSEEAGMLKTRWNHELFDGLGVFAEPQKLVAYNLRERPNLRSKEITVKKSYKISVSEEVMQLLNTGLMTCMGLIPKAHEMKRMSPVAGTHWFKVPRADDDGGSSKEGTAPDLDEQECDHIIEHMYNSFFIRHCQDFVTGKKDDEQDCENGPILDKDVQDCLDERISLAESLEEHRKIKSPVSFRNAKTCATECLTKSLELVTMIEAQFVVNDNALSNDNTTLGEMQQSLDAAKTIIGEIGVEMISETHEAEVTLVKIDAQKKNVLQEVGTEEEKYQQAKVRYERHEARNQQQVLALTGEQQVLPISDEFHDAIERNLAAAEQGADKSGANAQAGRAAPTTTTENAEAKDGVPMAAPVFSSESMLSIGTSLLRSGGAQSSSGMATPPLESMPLGPAFAFDIEREVAMKIIDDEWTTATVRIQNWKKARDHILLQANAHSKCLTVLISSVGDTTAVLGELQV